LYQHTMYIILLSLSNISIKTNFKQITRVKVKCIQYSEGDYILCMTSRYICCSCNDATLLCFLSHSNDMTSWLSSSTTENVLCNVAPFFYHHSVVIQHLLSDRRFSLISKENIHNVTINHIIMVYHQYVF
jgi:hypothetical protein